MNSIVIQIPCKSKIKYEKIQDPSSSRTVPAIAIDRIIDNTYPAAYGYLVGTRAGDGDEEDVFVLESGPDSHYPGQVLDSADYSPVAKIGLLDSGEVDNKLLLATDKMSAKLAWQRLADIICFLKIYKSEVNRPNKILFREVEVFGEELVALCRLEGLPFMKMSDMASSPNQMKFLLAE